MHPRRLRRLSTFPYTGPHRYSLTICAFERRPIFTTAALVDVLASQILRAADSADVDVVVYSFMPDHAHWVIEAGAASWPLLRFMKHAKQLSEFHGRRLIGARVWQPGYFDRVLRETEDVRVVVAYVLNNPVRAGLVASPGDYPFSGSGVCSLATLIEYVRRYL